MTSPDPALFQHVVRHQCCEPCRNCGTAYVGNYCHHCGQEALTGAPTAPTMVYEFLTRNMFERGKLPRTLWRLVRHPGALTVDFLAGRRQRYTRPVRLYFSLSLLFFLIMSLQSSSFDARFRHQFQQTDAAKGKLVTPAHADANGKKTDELEMVREFEVLRNQPFLLRWLPQDHRSRSSEAWQDKVRQFAHGGLSGEVMLDIIHFVRDMFSRALFVLLPAFALLLKWLFFRRPIPYGAHLLFAVHYHSLLFLALLLALPPMPKMIAQLVYFAAWLYLLPALRVSYGLSWWGAAGRWGLLSGLYVALLAITLWFCVVLFLLM